MSGHSAVVLDSSVWIEILGSGPLSKKCETELQSSSKIIVPTVVLFEVYRKIASNHSEDLALSALTLLTRHEIMDLNQEIAVTAADLSLNHRLPMADSFVLAHAQVAEATLITLDNDFAGISGVKVLRN